MAFSLLNWSSSGRNSRKRASDLITDPAKIAALLQQIIDERINLKITLPGSKQTFNSTVYEVDRKNLIFNIDELMPSAGHEILIKEKTLSAKGQGQGPMIAFTAKLVKAGKTSGAQYYKLQFPKSIKNTERRGMFRAKLGSAKRLDVTCTHAGKSLKGYVYDVSGMGMAFVLGGASNLEVKNILETCTISLANEGQINFELEICHTRKLGNDRTHIGGKIKKLNTEQKKTLGKFVRAIERDSLAKRRKD